MIRLQPPKARARGKARPPKAKPLDLQNLRSSHRNTRSRRMLRANGDAPQQKRHRAIPRGVKRERKKTRAVVDSFARANVLRAKVTETKKGDKTNENAPNRGRVVEEQSGFDCFDGKEVLSRRARTEEEM